MVKQFLLFVAAAFVRLVFISLIASCMHDYGGLIICTKQSIECFLVFYTAVTVINNHLCLHTSRLHILTEVVHDVFTYIVDTLVCCEESFHTGAAHKFVLVFLTNLVGKRIKFLLEFSLIHVHLHRNRLEVQFKCCTIGNRILECVLRDIAILILLRTKADKGVVIISIDWSTCQSEEECVWQCGTHLLAKVTFLCTMGLVHQKDDIISVIKHLAIN